MKKFLTAVISAVFFATGSAQPSSYWASVSAERAALTGSIKKSFSAADDAALYQLDAGQLKQALANAPERFSGEKGIVVSIPSLNGKEERFEVYEFSNFAPELQEQYPNIRAYVGTGIDDPSAVLRFSFSPKGIQTMVLRAGRPTEFIEPYTKNSEVYILFDSGIKRAEAPFACLTDHDHVDEDNDGNSNRSSMADNLVLKKFSLALSCTAEYTQYHGGTVADALAAMNATLTRVNGIYERDLAVKLELIPNNNVLIYTNPDTDPYSDNGWFGSWGNELQQNLNTTIGSENYDLGHLLGAFGGGGSAGCIGCVCGFGKGSAFTSPGDGTPEGDTFDIDYVAHEMGHQLGAFHTYSVENEGEGVNVEPGSGSTIMGYAGITNFDVQQHSDDYFAYRSIQQIQDNLSSKFCSVNVPLSNPPITINAGPDYTIPKGTAFVLRAVGAEANGANVTYTWEQNDTATDAVTGSQSITYPTKPAGPNFRSVEPGPSPDRYMPAFHKVLNNTLNADWEAVPTVFRTLNFTLTGRDNIAGGGQTKTDAMKVTVSAAAGPFAVVSQYMDGVVWQQGSPETIFWNVAGTTGNGVNTANVNILLSTDGGNSFPIVLAADTPNDGAETILVPITEASTNCRIMVQASGNIFYALNSVPFAIATLGTEDFGLDSFVLYPNPNNGNFTVEFSSDSGKDVGITVHDMRGRQVFGSSYANTSVFSGTVNLEGIQAGVYLVTVKDGERKEVKRIVIQ